MVTSLALLIAIACFLYWRKEKRLLKLREALILKLNKKQNEEQRLQYVRKIDELSMRLTEETTEKENLRTEMQRSQLELDQVTIIIKKEAFFKEKFQNSEIYKILHEKKNKKLTEDESDGLISSVNDIWPDHILYLKTLYPKISAEEILMCCLIKADIKQVCIASFLCKASNAIGMKRTRLAKKLFGENATSADLDSFIFSNKVMILQ
jgi:hypothetical protein